MAKIFLGLAILFMLLSAVLGFLTKAKITDVKSTLDATKSSLTTATAQVAKAQSDIKADKVQIDTLSTQVQTSSKAASDAQAAIDAGKKQVDDLSKQLEDSNKQVQTLTAQIASMPTTSGSNASQSSAADQAKIAELSTKIKEDEEITKKLTQQKADIQSKLDDYVKARNTLAGQAGARALSGEVLAVQPSWNFVIVSLGDRQGVTMNAPLVVRRGPTLVAKLRVTSVEPATSVADIVSTSLPQGMHVMPGDRVIYSGP